ncbi:sensor histidine kinase [Microbacterium halophytorum]|uniref:sensor histidine kinase n=1 Tax=Microbacterium halophytorum TaxID=2067568 RepID=UPI00131A212C|nr:sensor histidine kinase [Microbacterium halophytorum]
MAAADEPEVPDRAASPVVDGLLAAGTAVVLSAVIALSQAAATAQPAPLAYLFACGFGAVLLLRRSAPVLVLIVSALGTFGYYVLDLPPIGVALPVVAALFSAAEVGVTRWAVGAGAVVFAVSLYFRLRDAAPPLSGFVVYDAVSDLALIAAGIALGYGVRARRIRSEQQAEIARLNGKRIEREAESRMQAERERISRELHDTVGHTLSVISLHAGVGAEAVGADDRAAGDAFARIRDASTGSLRELRAMVRILRSASGDDGERTAIASLAAVPELLEAARASGLDVAAEISVVPSDLAAPVDTAAYRVIQESMTNVIRHAGAARARVRVWVEGDRLRVSVSDDGRGPAGADGGGSGLAGMEERVRLLGGTLTAGAPDGAGFRVDAEIPTRLT